MATPLLSGPLRRAVVRVAWPAAAGQLLVFLNNFVDFQWVTLLGRPAAAGLTSGMTLFWVLTALGQVFSIGLAAVVARRLGEGCGEEAGRAAAAGLKGALLASVAVGVAGWLLVPHLVQVGQGSLEAKANARDYLLPLFAGAPALFLFYAAEGVFRGHGETRRPLRALAIALGLNIALDPLLIFGLGLGVFGAGLATAISLGLTGLLLARAALRTEFVKFAEFRRRELDWAVVARIVRIGMPVSLHGIVFSLVYLVLIDETSRAGGDAATAALGLGIRFEGVSYMASVGCAAAAAAVVGQCLGAGLLLRARDAAWTAARLGMGISFLWGLLMYLLPESAVGLMTGGDAMVNAHTLDYFRIVGVSLAFMALEIVLEGAFSGAGNTIPPMLLGSSITVARIPLAILMARGLGWGVAGVFWTINFTCVARGLIFALWFARGRWIRGAA